MQLGKTIRATKVQILKFIRSKDVVETPNLVEKFGYSPDTARALFNGGGRENGLSHLYRALLPTPMR